MSRGGGGPLIWWSILAAPYAVCMGGRPRYGSDRGVSDVNVRGGVVT